MRITVVGAVLIVAAVAVGVLLILALQQHVNEFGEQESSSPRRNPPSPNGPST